ncbi:hypothetical protein C0J52_17405 [Blattella germanica]|nr:hypothetical protein C0J52_17405 [Blattella germanica]
MPVRFEQAAVEEEKREKYHDIILASFKCVQMTLGITSTLIHVMTIYTHYQSSPHVVLFCGTYFGFSIISAGLLYEYLIGDRNPNHLRRQGKTHKDFESTVVITITGVKGDAEVEELGDEDQENIVVKNLFVRPEDELHLHAFCIEFVVWLKKWFKEDFKALFKRRKKKVSKPVTEVDFDEFVILDRAYRDAMEEVNVEPPTLPFEFSSVTEDAVSVTH